MRIFFVFFALGQIGCFNSTINEEDFLVEYTQEVCSQIFSCVSEEDQATLDQFYGSEEQCATDMQDDISESIVENELEYSPQTGAECLEHIRDMSCADEESEDDSCNNVYTQPE
jgi:hypothetical protein